MVFVTRPSATYHHGSLRSALVDAGVQLAREGGPAAIVLREVARRIGVSPNAAYRHFADLPELSDAVADAALAALAASMRRELAALPGGDDPLMALLAVGRGYVHFALDEPGLFAAAFSRAKDHIDPDARNPGRSADRQRPAARRARRPGRRRPARSRGPRRRRHHGLGSVHGLSMLLLGPLGAVPPADREPMIDAALGLVCRGLTWRATARARR